MNRAEIFVAVVFAVFSLLMSVTVFYALRSRHLKRLSWSNLMDKLQPVDRQALRTVALDLTDENGNSWGEGTPVLDADMIWKLLGGLEGLERLEANCNVLIDLATYVQTWHPEAIAVAQQLRLNTREIQWHVSRMKAAADRGNLKSTYAMYGQKVAATYFQMTDKLLALYHDAAGADLQKQIEAVI